MINLDAEDFGNFLVHPLLTKADLPSGEFHFRREGTSLNVELGRATFTGVWQGEPVVMEACQPERCVYVCVLFVCNVVMHKGGGEGEDWWGAWGDTHASVGLIYRSRVTCVVVGERQVT